MTRSRRLHVWLFLLGVATVAGCDPYDPLCEIYMTPECGGEDPPPDPPGDPGEPPGDPGDPGEPPSEPPPEPPPQPPEVCHCPNGWTVIGGDCSLCPQPYVCPGGAVVMDPVDCPLYDCGGYWSPHPDCSGDA